VTIYSDGKRISDYPNKLENRKVKLETKLDPPPTYSHIYNLYSEVGLPAPLTKCSKSVF